MIQNYVPGHTAIGGSLAAGRFGETAINLTNVLADLNLPCENTTSESTWAHSRASDTLTSEMKDYVAPSEFIVNSCKARPDFTSTPAARVESGKPIFTTARDDVLGNGTYRSGSFTPSLPGIYRCRVTYSGDANNHGAGPTPCGDHSETVAVSRARPGITTEASPTTVLGSPIHDTATLSGGLRPRGIIKFKVFGPTDPKCTAPVATSTVKVSGNGAYQSPDFTPTTAETWLWVAIYSGDRHNHSAGTACGDRGEEVVVYPPPPPPLGTPTLTTTSSQNVQAGSAISDTAHLAGGMNPTGAITFTVYGPDDAQCSSRRPPR